MNLVNPYENTGIDYTVHLWVNRNGKAEKMYLLIFPCLAIRSIHIEIVQDISTKAFIQAFIRFSLTHTEYLPTFTVIMQDPLTTHWAKI